MSYLFETKQYVFNLSDVVCVEKIVDKDDVIQKVYVKLYGDVKIMLDGKDARELVAEYMEMWDNEEICK